MSSTDATWIIDAFREISGDNPIIFLDYDGTLTPIMPRPELAAPDDKLKGLLKEFAEKFDTVIVTGRTLESIMGFLGDSYSYVAMHGALFFGNGKLTDLSGKLDGYLSITERITSGSAELEARFPGLKVYDKRGGVLFHYGAMEKNIFPELSSEVEKIALEVSMETYYGKNVIELRIPGVNKGSAIFRLRNGRPALIAGDDITDEEAFRANPDAITVHIGTSKTAARYSLADYAGMRKLMRLMIDLV
ncbi:MAG: trehalose-phosphatase [Candidatus Thermoplasmatota archaeon]|nr:trehalose-phosphatase [Candidatus Thermoplasmatota archaeon]